VPWRLTTYEATGLARVRETPDWKKHAADLESEMLKRGMRFEVIDWSEDQPPH
jgi:hypothetical protein